MPLVDMVQPFDAVGSASGGTSGKLGKIGLVGVQALACVGMLEFRL
jgi:hypothetical protein